MFTGDPRMTEILTLDAEKLMQALDSGEEEQSSNTTIVHLPHLPGPLQDLNARTLQSVVTAITKDLSVDWSGENWWPQDIPFCKPRTIPPSHKGMLPNEV